jgi:hypothetical protein
VTGRTPVAALVAGLVLAGGSDQAQACAGCRNPSLPISRLSNVRLSPGQVRASAMVNATAVNVVHEAGCLDVASCQEIPVQPRYLHDQDIYPAELRALAEVGLTESWGVEAQVPFRVTRTSIRYATLDGRAFTPLDPDVHHRNETVAGFGDPWLLGRFGVSRGKLTLTARAGLSLPLGRTEEDPFALGAAGQPHQHIQLGNGTFDPIVALDASRSMGRWQITGYGQAQLTLYEGRRGFRAGNRFVTGFQGGARLGEMLAGALGLDLLYDGPERWGGTIQQDGNLGRTELLAGASLTYPFGATVVSALVRVPVYRDIVSGDEAAGRLSSPVMLSLIVSRTF